MRDDFSEKTKRVLAERAGGRCSFPGCDRQCWLPNSDANKATSIGVAAHIKAASAGGPRYDPNQSSENRKSAENGIFLCQDHAHLIDHDESAYSAETLLDWKDRHEKQISGEIKTAFALPTIQVSRSNGITFDVGLPQQITQEVVADLVEHQITVRNDSDYEYRRIGFKIQYPELLGRFLHVHGPAGFDGQVFFEQDKVRVTVTGGGQVKTPGNDFLGSVIVEGKSMLPGDTITLDIPSLPDHSGLAPAESHEGDHAYHFWVHGENTVAVGSVYKQMKFSTPLFYSRRDRTLRKGNVHEARPETDPYVVLNTF